MIKLEKHNILNVKNNIYTDIGIESTDCEQVFKVIDIMMDSLINPIDDIVSNMADFIL